MFVLRGLCLVAVLVAVSYGAGTPDTETQLRDMMNKLQTFTDNIKQTVTGLARQVMLQQMYVEEQTRANGGSGVKMIRANGRGTEPYYTASLSAGGINAIHEHSNYDRTVGMGEVIAVLNGVEFRTRHNDYRLVMPSTTSHDYNKVEDVPFPEVPPSVKNKKTVNEQVIEMQEYFKAFAAQDPTTRDYRPYFKPTLCYMEGGWTTNTKTLDEPFQSDRHFIDANSWFDLQNKVKYTSSSGGKSQNENYSYLPTTIMNVTEDGEPLYAQWNYRILCHPIKTALTLRDLQLHDDLAARMYLNRNMTQFATSKAARFNVAPSTSKNYERDSLSGHFTPRHYLHGRLDDIMYEIPGKDNYNTVIHDKSFDMDKLRVDTKNPTPLNTAHYHRHFKVSRTRAMGLQTRNRGFSDPNLFVAQTSNPRIANVSVTDCPRVNGRVHCTTYSTRHTYAIPLEIIWLTPLSTWNPYNLHYQRDNNAPAAGGRNGGFTADKAFNGTSRGTYYYTPVEFYHDGEGERDPADTAKDAVGVLDAHGNVQRVTASGVRIFTPEIPGVGKIRIRYPIVPFHEEGNNVYKNLIALQDITMDMSAYARMLEKQPGFSGAAGREADMHFRTSTTHANPPGAHYHDLFLTPEEMKHLSHFGNKITVFTTEDSGHQHELVLQMDPAHHNFNRLIIVSCDGQHSCWDGHTHYAYNQKD